MDENKSFASAGDFRTSEYLSRFIDSRKPLAVLLVGSRSRGISLPLADTDIAAVFEYKQNQDWIVVEGLSPRVEVEQYWAADFDRLSSSPILMPRQLREAGRLFHGVPLYSRWDNLRNIMQRLGSAIPDPQTTASLLATASVRSNKDVLEALGTASQRIWSLQAAAFSLAVVALNCTTIRYQKPRWVFQDLTYCVSCGREISDLLVDIFAPRLGRGSDYILKVSSEYISDASEISRVSLTNDLYKQAKINKINRHKAEAFEMNDAGFFEAAAISSLIAARLMSQFIDDQIRDGTAYSSTNKLTLDFIDKLEYNSIFDDKSVASIAKRISANVISVDNIYKSLIEKIY